ncbi:MAG: hypothetical protein ACRDND_00445 [Streptosporangiaceae bacterium]
MPSTQQVACFRPVNGGSGRVTAWPGKRCQAGRRHQQKGQAMGIGQGPEKSGQRVDGFAKILLHPADT